MKKLVYSGIATLAILLTGCGGGSDAASCRFAVQQNLDTGNYAAVIAALKNPSQECMSAYNTDEWNVDLGAAYMGEAGLSVSDIIGLIGTDTGSGVTYKTFIDGVSTKQTSTALTSLGNAGDAYTSALSAANCTAPEGSDKDICLYIGLADTMLATTSMSFLVPDIAALFDTTDIAAQDAAKEEMTASSCALQFANQGTVCGAAIATGSVVASPAPFTDVNSNTRDYRDIAVILDNGHEFHRLATVDGPPLGTTVLTQGYCNGDFSGQAATWINPLFACPLNQDFTQEDQNITTLLVDTLNGGLDSVSGALSGDSALQGDIDDYKREIDRILITDPLVQGDGIITVEEIQAYLLTL